MNPIISKTTVYLDRTKYIRLKKRLMDKNISFNAWVHNMIEIELAAKKPLESTDSLALPL